MPWSSKVHDPHRKHGSKIKRAYGRSEYRQDVRGKMYHLPEWRDPIIGLRAMHIAKEPMCRECMKLGIRKIGRDVDHIIPHEGNMTLFLDEHNLQTLCASHHSIKTQKEKRS